MKVLNVYQTIKKTIGEALPDKLLLACLNSIVHNDDAHNLDHIENVILTGHDICNRVDADMKTRQMTLAGCLMHDLGCRYHRATHHIIGYGLAFEYLEKYADGMFSEDEIMIIAESCMQHRGSYKGERTHLVCELVALADRGTWNEYQYTMRSVQFHTSNLGKMHIDDVRKEVQIHIPDKFGENGYAWTKYPALGHELFKDEIARFKAYAVDPKAIDAMIDRILVDLEIPH